MTRLCWFLVLCALTATSWAVPVCLGVSANADPTAVAACSTHGVKLVRLRADWSQLQPDAKTWSFARLDTAIREAVAHQLNVILVLGPTPAWSITYLTNPTPEQIRRAKPNMAAYTAYVTMLAKRYNGKVAYYQLWDCPGPATLLATAGFVQALYRTGTQALHKVNPALQAIAAVPGGVNLGWINEYLQDASGSAWPDVLLLTPATATLAEENIRWRVQPLRELVLPPKGAPALWADLPLGGPRHCPKAVIATALLQDLSTILFHPSQEDIDLMADEDAAKTLRLLERLQGTEYLGYASPIPGVDIAMFRNATSLTGLLAPTKPVAIPLKPSTLPLAEKVAVPGDAVELVPLDGEARKVPVPTETTLNVETSLALLTGITLTTTGRSPRDTQPALGGDTIGFDPTGKNPYVICPLPELPGGKFTVTKHGEQNIISTEGEGQPWIYLEIPEGFLFYNKARVPVEIMVKVYGVREAQESGFSLYYDAIGGMKHSPWQMIDTGEDVIHTYTIRLNDALFADRDGYAFRLEMGCSTENIHLVDLTVKKLPK